MPSEITRTKVISAHFSAYYALHIGDVSGCVGKRGSFDGDTSRCNNLGVVYSVLQKPSHTLMVLNIHPR